MSSYTTWSRRPKIVPPASKTDKIIEAIALIGVLLSIIIVIYSAITLPDIIPTHYKPLGGVDTYGSKWPILVIFMIPIIFLYALLTVLNRYPYTFNYNTIVTEENAPRLYRIGRSLLRYIKAIFVWQLLILEWFFVILLSNNPGLTGLSWISWIIILLFIIILAIIIVYTAKKLKQEGRPKHDIERGNQSI